MSYKVKEYRPEPTREEISLDFLLERAFLNGFMIAHLTCPKGDCEPELHALQQYQEWKKNEEINPGTNMVRIKESGSLFCYSVKKDTHE